MPSIDLLYNFKVLNAPGMSTLALKVTFPPGASTPPHTHAGAFVSVTVLTGSVLNKMNDDPMTIKKVGDSFFEAPGCKHRISDNASETEEASVIATFMIVTEKLKGILEKDGVMGLVVIDDEWREPVLRQMERMAG